MMPEPLTISHPYDLPGAGVHLDALTADYLITAAERGELPLPLVFEELSARILKLEKAVEEKDEEIVDLQIDIDKLKEVVTLYASDGTAGDCFQCDACRLPLAATR